jgi:hypothetical protein
MLFLMPGNIDRREQFASRSSHGRLKRDRDFRYQTNREVFGHPDLRREPSLQLRDLLRDSGYRWSSNTVGRLNRGLHRRYDDAEKAKVLRS